jgi:hypothetical protein
LSPLGLRQAGVGVAARRRWPAVVGEAELRQLDRRAH